MFCFEVYVNGVRKCRAGVGASGVLTAIMTWVGPKGRGRRNGSRQVRSGAEIDVGGLYTDESGADAFPRWLFEPVEVGDEVIVRVVDAETADAPFRVDRQSASEVVKQEREHYKRLKPPFRRKAKAGAAESPRPRVRRKKGGRRKKAE